MTNQFKTAVVNGTYISGILMLLHWMRATRFLMVSELLTPLLKILYQMVYDLLRFFALTFICFFMFVFSFTVFFIDLPVYSNLWSTTIHLFESMLGNSDFTVFDTLARPWVGKLAYIGYLLFMSITLLNFVIAIISETYDNFRHLKQSLFL